MKDVKNVRPGEELDWGKLENYLLEKLPELNGNMEVGQFHGGHANLTYLIKFGKKELVLRRPPFGKIAPGAHDMKREYRVLSKLYKYFPPAPRAYLLCEDENIVGAKFVLMERCSGVVPRYEVPDIFKKYEHIEIRLTDAMVRAQADLHKVDVEAAGLTKLGRPDGFINRQLEGWAKRWDLSKTELNNDMETVLKLLREDVPEPQAVSIIHNDLKFDNCQFQPDNPDKVTSIFDWDMCTLGDPLIDFGSTLGYWPDEFFSGYDMPVSLKGDFPKKDFLRNKYAEYTGFNLERMPWYEAFAYWKGAVIAQQLYRRYINGSTKDKRMEKFGGTAKIFAKKAVHVLVANGE